MQGIIAIIASMAGIICAFFIGYRIGTDRGYSKGTEETTYRMMEIHKQGEEMVNKELDELGKVIYPDCGQE